MKLKKIIKDLEISVGRGSKDIEITGITSHSKSVGPGFLFIARKGDSFDGNDFIPDAILAGAVCILSDIVNPFLENVVQILSQDIVGLEAKLASRFYGNPANELFTIGITGTNGKTTTTHLAWHLINGLELCGMIGTIDRRIGEIVVNSDLTTPDCFSTQKMLYEVLSRGGRSIVMEVSSHALDQNRVDEVGFDLALFTNLSHEHLDYHKEMKYYKQSKIRLFEKLKKSGKGIVNIDDEESHAFTSATDNGVITFGIDRECDYRARTIEMSLEGTKFCVEHCGEEFPMAMQLFGRFNIYNALGAIVIARERGVTWDEIQSRLMIAPGIRGRMERVSNDLGADIFIDFAHTPAALKLALGSLRELVSGKICVVFGCGGERDLEKRPLMAKVVEEFADWAIVTNDNPRHEDPEAIICSVVSGFEKRNFEVEKDRKAAIRKGIEKYGERGCLLIAGRGHEQNQLHGGKTIAFSDLVVAKEMLDVLV